MARDDVSSDNKGPRFAIAAIDLDDTLVGRDGAISAANVAAVERLIAIGTRVLLASGSPSQMIFATSSGTAPFSPLLSRSSTWRCGSALRD